MTADRRARVLAVLVAVALGGSVVAVVDGVAEAAATDRATMPPDGVVSLLGHGYGHGRGMSQYGAYGGARSGATSGQILDFYYPGTQSVAAAPYGVKVLITDGDPNLTVLPDAGLTVHDLGTGLSATLPTGPVAWRIVRFGGGFGVHFEDADGTWEPFTMGGTQLFTGPMQFSGPDIVRLVRTSDVRGFRGALVAVPNGSGLRVVNNVDLQSYLRGVVPREMPASWPAAALEAQSIAARTYAVYKIEHAASGQYWDICDTTACQVYGGARTWVGGSLTTSESASSDAAVAATNGLIRQSGGQSILAEFSSSDGGWTVDGGRPYLAAQADPWDGVVASSVHSWTDIVSRTDLQSAFPAVGTLSWMEVSARDGHGDWGGRVRTLVLHGVDGSGAPTAVSVTGDQFRRAAGLKSTWFTFDVALSAIQARYDGDAMLRAALGDPVGTEQYGMGFAWQQYANGRLYWSAAAGVHLLRGDILAKFLAVGGPGVLGVPTTDEGLAGTGGAFNHFADGASIYWTPSTGAHLVMGAIREHWLALGAEWQLGFPTGGETAVAGVAGAVQQSFTAGQMFWSAGTGAHELRGGVATAWSAAGGAASLGLPTSDERAVPGGGVIEDFSRGYTVVWTSNSSQVVGGGIRAAWLATGGAGGALGLPTSDEADTPDPGGRYSAFAGGTIVWTPRAGGVVLAGAIGVRWTAAGGLNSPLGLPLTPVAVTGDGRARFVPFSNGASIYQATGAQRAFLVRGAVYARWTATGGPAGLGLPVTDETVLGTGTGVYQIFARGKVLWSPTTGAQPLYGAIGAAYDRLGAEWSPLGLPVRAEYPVPGGTREDFEHGWISWDAATGATTVTRR